MKKNIKFIRRVKLSPAPGGNNKGVYLYGGINRKEILL